MAVLYDEVMQTLCHILYSTVNTLYILCNAGFSNPGRDTNDKGNLPWPGEECQASVSSSQPNHWAILCISEYSCQVCSEQAVRFYLAADITRLLAIELAA